MKPVLSNWNWGLTDHLFLNRREKSRKVATVKSESNELALRSPASQLVNLHFQSVICVVIGLLSAEHEGPRLNSGTEKPDSITDRRHNVSININDGQRIGLKPDPKFFHREKPYRSNDTGGSHNLNERVYSC